MLARDIIKVIEEFAPLDIQEKWDNSGLCIGSDEVQVTSVLVGFDCTEDLVDEAIRLGANMIITHHPLIFSGLKKINPNDIIGAVIFKAIQAGIVIYSAHTTADKVIEGVSGAMARKLGLDNIEILDSEVSGYGLGVVGDLPNPLPIDEFIKLVKKEFNLKYIKSSAKVIDEVKRVAMCGGSGSSLINNAYNSGAQIYLSGDISYHYFFTKKDFMLMDIGHYESEIEIVDILFSLLKKNFPTFAVYKTDNIYSNPISYF